mgnify:CR=1 FL=1
MIDPTDPARLILPVAGTCGPWQRSSQFSFGLPVTYQLKVPAPPAIACRKPVSAAVPAPGSGSLSTTTSPANAAASPAVPSVEPLSTTTSVKSGSDCAASAASVPGSSAASL